MNNNSQKINSQEEQSKTAKDFAQAIVETIREPLLILDDHFNFIFANPYFYTTFQISEGEIAGKSIFEVGNNQWDIPALRTLLEAVLPKKKDFLDFEVSHHFPNIGQRTFLVSGNPLKRGKREEKLILLSFKDITEKVQDREREKNYFNRFQEIIMNAPAMICTLRGPDHIFELANNKYFQLLGNRDIIGKPVREAIPEIENQGFIEILNEVYTTGKPFIGNELAIQLDVGEKELKNSFLNFVYQPTLDNKGNVNGIFVHAVDVTEQVLARKKVEKSEQQVRNFIESAPFPIAVYEGREMKITFANQSVKDLWGKGNNLIGKLFPQVLPELEIQKIYEKLDKVFRTGKPFHATNQKIKLLIGNKLEVFYFNYSYIPLFNSSGEVYGIMNTAADVTGLNLAKKKVEASEQRYQELIHSSPSMIALFKGKDYNIEIANDAILEAWGKGKDIIGKPLLSVLPELVQQGFKEILEQVYQTGKPHKAYEMPVELLRYGKMELAYFNFIYYPQRDLNGEIIGVVDIATEVTPQAEFNKKIKESESHFRQMADLMPGKVLNTDAKGNAIYFNRHWMDDTGLSPEELQGRGWQKMIHPEDFEEFIKSWKESLVTGKEFEKEFRCLYRNGEYKWQLGRAVPVKDDAGKIKLWINSAIEIQKLKEEEKRKEGFLKMVSHELKTPVTSIKGYVQLLLSLLDEDKNIPLASVPLNRSLERIDHQISRLTRLIAEMLDLSRIEENRLELRKEKFSINELVEETIRDINFTNTQHKIDVFHNFKAEIIADKDRIGQVLINFITNGIKYSPENENIVVAIEKIKNSEVAVSVKDHGIGIEEKDQKNIFGRFYRVDGNSQETYSGFGIGLYLANEIIERHKGTIKVESELGKGSVFTFTLPYEI